MITLLYAGLLGLMMIVLTVRIIRLRWKHRVGLETGGVKELTKAVRAHGNFAEFVPLILVLMALVEVHDAPRLLVHASGCLLVASRLCHVIGLTRSVGFTPWRAVGVVGTNLVLLVLSLYAIVTFLQYI